MPIFLLALVEITLFFTNYTPGTYLIGWDNVMPELNFKLNLWRNLFAVWQEYRGLGLLDGMSHAANLVHTLFLWLLSFIFAQNLLRYMFTFLMHGLGGVGMYLLLIQILPEKKRPTIATIGALFYLFNAFTVQMFYTPLEAFSVHFAALPWLAFTFLQYILRGDKKRLILFLITSLLVTPQFFVTPLLLPIMLLLGAISFTHLKQWKRITTGAAGFICINAFWLFPYLFSIPRVAPVIQSAKINQMSSNEIFLKNQAFGDAQSILLFRGFGLNLTDRLKDGSYGWLMAAWRDHLYSPITMTLYSGFFVVVLVGLTQSLVIAPFIMLFRIEFFMLGNDIPLLRDIHALLRTYVPFFGEAFRFTFTKFSLLYAFSYTILFANGLRILSTKKIGTIAVLLACIGIFSISWPSFTGVFIYKNLRVHLPIEYQDLLTFMNKQDSKARTALLPQPEYWSWKYYGWGFRGSGFLWYGLPQPTMDRAFDPWSAQNENYYWELSRALYGKDAAALEAVFAKYDIHYVLLDENLISASNDRSLFIDETKALLAQISTIHVARTFGNITVYERTNETGKSFVSLKANLPTVSPAYNWTDDDVAYQNLGDYITDSSCHVSRIACHVYPFRSLFTKRSINEREFTIEENEDSLNIHSRALAGFPLILKEGNVQEQHNDEKQRVGNSNFNINIGELVPANHTDELSSRTANTNETIPATILFVNNNNFSADTPSKKRLGAISTDPNQAADKLVNKPDMTRNQDFLSRLDITTSVAKEGTFVNATIRKADALVFEATHTAILNPQAVVPCGISGKGTAQALTIGSSPASDSGNPSEKLGTGQTIKLDQEAPSGTSLRFTSQNQRGCLSFDVSQLPHKDGYLVAVESRHITGRPLLLAFINDTAKHAELETYLESQKEKGKRQKEDWQTDYFILPPLASDGLGYTVYLSNDSIGNQQTVNDIKSIKFYRFPYQKLVTLRSLEVQSKSAELQPQGRTLNSELTVEHPNPAYYKVSMRQRVNQDIADAQVPLTLMISQSFDPGWLAYRVETCDTKYATGTILASFVSRITCNVSPYAPFLFGTQIKDHVLVNNWENGWLLPEAGISNYPIIQSSNNPIPNKTTVILFFWPQLLEWAGFLLLPIPFIYFLFAKQS